VHKKYILYGNAAVLYDAFRDEKQEKQKGENKRAESRKLKHIFLARHLQQKKNIKRIVNFSFNLY
jgi:hypothetical protein